MIIATGIVMITVTITLMACILATALPGLRWRGCLKIV